MFQTTPYLYSMIVVMIIIIIITLDLFKRETFTHDSIFISHTTHFKLRNAARTLYPRGFFLKYIEVADVIILCFGHIDFGLHLIETCLEEILELFL
jgi:hypothetical protein